MQRFISLIRQFFIKNSNSQVIILGTEYPEFKLCKELKAKGDNVCFFISEDPWKYNTFIEGVVCRYPIELYALCERHNVGIVYYEDDRWLGVIPELPSMCELRHFQRN